MSLVSIRNIGITYGAHDVCAGISAALPIGGKVGLVGPNGVGKTSLLRAISGVAPATQGSIHLARGARVGYLRQEAVDAFVNTDHSVHAEMETAFAHVLRQAEELRAMEARMAAGETDASLLEAYGVLQHAFEEGGGYDYEVRIAQVLDGLGFPRDMWETSIAHLSGGQKTRALLARLLLEAPDLLILDEPTNHLDVDAVEWLENTMKAWKGAIIVASHDRYFLNNVVDTVWEMDAHHIESYRGNYSAYVRQRDERWERNREVAESEIERLKDALETIERYFAWRKFEEAKGRLQRLGRELVAIEHYGLLGIQGKSWGELGIRTPSLMTVDEARQRIKAIRPPKGPPPPMKLQIREERRSGHRVLRTHRLKIGYGGETLVSVGDLDLERLDRVALVGPNGAGKTTFLRTVLGEISPVAGEVEMGVNVVAGYFAQAHDGLDGSMTVLQTLLAHKIMSEGEARSYAARYLFRGDDVYKSVSALSGGERARLALGILALDGVNLLLLDEPTNHLDIPAQETLQEALDAFGGTILLVSHDRYLVDRLATGVWEVRDGHVRVVKGSYADYLAQRDGVTTMQSARKKETRKHDPAPLTKRQGKPAEERAAEIERTLAEIRARLDLEIAAGNFMEAARLDEEYRTTNDALDALIDEWAAEAV